jgi:hypothetical protein
MSDSQTSRNPSVLLTSTVSNPRYQIRALAFYLFILDPHSVGRWKFVYDTKNSEIVSKNSASNIQTAVDYVQNWSSDNCLKLNELKCKELVIDFSRAVNTFQRVIVNGNELELVSHAKILGLVISDDLKWNDHVYYIIKKVNKRINSVVQLNRAKVQGPRSVLERRGGGG